jgi:sn-glycerol 3-phosphate transport system permease protein
LSVADNYISKGVGSKDVNEHRQQLSPFGNVRRLVRGALPYLLLLPALVFLTAFTYWPFLQAIISSLSTKRRSNDIGEFAGLDNYRRIFEDADFTSAAMNNIIYALGTTGPSIVIALILAISLRNSSRLNSLLRSVFFFPTLIPLVAASAVFLFVFMPDIGLLDYYLAKLGARSVNWLGNPNTALASLIGLTIWKNAGYYMLFFLAGLQGISQDVEEAAVLEGATRWQIMRYVTLPLLGPTITFVVIIALIASISQVDHVIVMTQGAPNNATSLLLHYIYQQAHENYDLGKATAATVVSLAILLSISFVSIRTMEKSVHYEN